MMIIIMIMLRLRLIITITIMIMIKIMITCRMYLELVVLPFFAHNSRHLVSAFSLAFAGFL